MNRALVSIKINILVLGGLLWERAGCRSILTTSLPQVRCVFFIYIYRVSSESSMLESKCLLDHKSPECFPTDRARVRPHWREDGSNHKSSLMRVRLWMQMIVFMQAIILTTSGITSVNVLDHPGCGIHKASWYKGSFVVDVPPLTQVASPVLQDWLGTGQWNARTTSTTTQL